MSAISHRASEADGPTPVPWQNSLAQDEKSARSIPLRLRDVAITHVGHLTPTPARVSFDVQPGEVVLLLGPSGSGKSTLTLALNGLIPHALEATLDGTIQVAGEDTTASTVAELSRNVAMVFQDPDAQLVTGSILDEVAFGPENLRLPVDVVLERAETALRRVGLWDRRHDNPDRLSGGGRQRLAIAAALAMESELLVLDEPTANLDPTGIEEVYDALRDLVAAGDHAVVLVEHNLDAAIGFAHRVVALDARGNVVADGPVDEVLRERADELHDLGVWLPTATLAALRLREAGYEFDRLPLTPQELRSALEVMPPRRGAPDAPLRTHRRRRDSDSAPLIRVRGLDVRRGRTHVLHGIDLDVEAGEFLAVVGANGAGKSTLVQAIAGVNPPPRGTVSIGDVDPGRADVATIASQIGFVFQNPEHQFVTQTVFDELAHGMRRRRHGSEAPNEAEIDERVADLLVRFGLEGREQTHPFLLSGGEKRRLSVGTALVGGAPVLALDEPTFGQDRARADELLRLLDDLHLAGTTIIVVTHDIQLVSEHATQVAVLGGGRLLAHGPTADIFGDTELIESAGLRLPPLAAVMHDLPGHPELDGVVRLADLPRPLRADAAR